MRKILMIVASFALVSASAAVAQPMPPGPPPHGGPGGPGGGPGGPGGPGAHGGPEMAEKMRELRGQLLRKEAGLDEASAAKAQKVLDTFDQERQKNHRELGEARRALGELAKLDAKEEGAWKKALDALVAANRTMQDLRGRELDELRKVLSQREAAKVILALERMQQIMRREGRQARKAWLKAELDRMDDDEGDGPPPPPGPPPPAAPAPRPDAGSKKGR